MHSSLPPSPHPKGHLDRFSHFAGLATVTDRQTDDATRSVTIGRIYVRSTAMRCKKEVIFITAVSSSGVPPSSIFEARRTRRKSVDDGWRLRARDSDKFTIVRFIADGGAKGSRTSVVAVRTPRPPGVTHSPSAVDRVSVHWRTRGGPAAPRSLPHF